MISLYDHRGTTCFNNWRPPDVLAQQQWWIALRLETQTRHQGVHLSKISHSTSALANVPSSLEKSLCLYIINDFEWSSISRYSSGSPTPPPHGELLNHSINNESEAIEERRKAKITIHFEIVDGKRLRRIYQQSKKGKIFSITISKVTYYIHFPQKGREGDKGDFLSTISQLMNVDDDWILQQVGEASQNMRTASNVQPLRGRCNKGND